MAEILNINTISEIVGGDKDSFIPIVEDFELNGLELLGAISNAHEIGDAEGVKQATHQLKGSSGTLGLESLFMFCKEIEQRELSGIDHEFLERLVKSFEDAMEQLKSFMGMT